MSQIEGEALPVLPPLAAYRQDVDHLEGRAVSGDDGLWLAAAVGLDHASRADAESSEELLAEALSLLEEATPGAPGIAVPASGGPFPIVLARARLLAERMEDASAWHLAVSVLTAAERLAGDVLLEQGRLRAQRARIQWKLGASNVAEATYRELVSIGEEAEEPELVARGYAGLAALSQVRGNYPAVGRWALRAAAIADAGSFADVSALAHQLAMVSAGQRGEHAQALLHGWAAFNACRGNTALEAELLLNLAQLLLTVQEEGAALAGFIAALERDPPLRIAFPAWGGVATSAALLGKRQLVVSAANRIKLLGITPGLHYARAFAFAEAALALQRVGADAGSWHDAAQQIADRYGFHEIRLLLADRSRNPTAVAEPSSHGSPVRGTAAAVITAIAALADVESSRVLT